MTNLDITYSLIIPHRNDHIRLERLLRSVPTHREDLEVIVVDDCSYVEIPFKSVQARWPRIRWLSTEANSGAGVARNVGLNAAIGRWLVFADSDDEFIPDAFETFDQLLTADDEVVYFLADAVREADGSPSARADAVNELVAAAAVSGTQESLYQLRLHHVVPWAKVYSREFAESTGLHFDAVRHGNDLAFNVLSAIQASRIKAHRVAVYRVYRRPESLTSDLSADVFMGRFFVSLSVAHRLAKLGHTGVWPGTGQMLNSLRYGPRIMLTVWWHVFRSPMKVNLLRALKPKHWQIYFRSKLNQKE